MSRPQHSKLVRLRAVPAALGIGAVLALAGCSAGQTTETDTQVAAVNGASNSTQNPMAVRDAQLTFPAEQHFYPKGSAAPVQAVLVNSGPQVDRLLDVTSPFAGSAQLGGMTTLPSNTSLRAFGEPATGTEDPSVQGQPTDRREVKITLQGLKRDIGAGVTIPVTFVFEKAGQVTVDVPIGADPKPRPEHGTPNEGH